MSLSWPVEVRAEGASASGVRETVTVDINAAALLNALRT